MSERLTPVTLNQAASQEYGFGRVRAYMVANEGYGRVINNSDSRQLAGQVVIERTREEFSEGGIYTKRNNKTIMPLQSAIRQARAVAGTQQLRVDELAGTYDEYGLPVIGEIEAVGVVRTMLRSWNESSAEHRQAGRDTLEAIDARRTNAVNPYRVIAGDIARRIRTLKDIREQDNPQAILWQLPELEEELKGNYEQVWTSFRRNTGIELRLTDWWHTNMLAIADAEGHITEYLRTGNKSAWVDFKIAGQQAGNEVAIFNAIAGAAQQNKSRMPEREDVEDFINGTRFVGRRNKLLRHVRGIRRMTDDEMRGDAGELRLAEIDAAAEELESLPMTGPYKVLRDKILPRFRFTRSSLLKAEFTDARKMANATEALINEHVLPKNDPTLAVWYGRQL